MIGSTISHYKILEKLGEGGMGIVYKAQDTKLDRLVALKFLPEHVSVGSADLERFTQEAKAAAGLNHPNICTIHGIEEADKKNFIVMEFVDGQTLQEKKSTLSMKQALEVGIQIAEGLAAAHEKGIIHRDIKPENIMIRRDGRVQVMDFGLAKLRGASRLTKEGSTVGTAGYMSPEQVQGDETDYRSDIFSLGVILYEMLSGLTPFKGVHETAIAYEIVNVDAQPMSSVKPDIDPNLDNIVLECLEKDPNNRTQSAKQVAIDLKRLKRESGQGRLTGLSPVRKGLQTIAAPEIARWAAGGRRSHLLPWVAAGLSVLGMIAVGLAFLLSPPPKQQTLNAFLLPPENANFFFYGNEAGPPSLSPNGQKLTFVAVDSTGSFALYVQRLDESSATRLAETEGAWYPFWSPDSRYIGFFARGKLKKIDATGGAPIVLCDAANPRGGSWSSNGMIAFTGGPATPISIVSAAGGTANLLTKFDVARGENSHRWPWFLPDGNHFLYFARTVATGLQSGGGSICVGSIDGTTKKTLIHASSNAVFASDHILYARGGTLVSQLFDPGPLDLNGEAQTIAEGLVFDESTLRSPFTVSQNNILVYQRGSVKLGSRLGIFDRSGKTLHASADVPEYINPRFSFDMQRIVTSIYDQQTRNVDIWIYDIARNARSRFTFGASFEQFPIWSPDGKQIVFNANPVGVFNLYEKSSSGASNEEVLLATPYDKRPRDLSADGALLLYDEFNGSQTQSDLWILPLKGERKPTPFLQTEFDELEGRFSHDGRWIAYTSNESGQNEVYVRPYPTTPGRWQVSVSGGFSPRWRRDGKELFYVSPDNKLMAAEITLRGTTLDVGNVRRLFDVPFVVHLGEANYDVSPDGKRFLVNMRFESQNQTPLTVVINWDLKVRNK